MESRYDQESLLIDGKGWRWKLLGERKKVERVLEYKSEEGGSGQVWL